MVRSSLVCGAALLLSLSGCPGADTPDGGSLPDAGTVQDAGILPDGGELLDGGDTPDAGNPTDGGQVLDAGPGDGGEPVCATGAVSGVTCAPNGQPMPGAVILFEGQDCASTDVQHELTSDGAGAFELDGLAEGTWTVTLSRGPFARTQTVEVTAGTTVSLTGADAGCFSPDAGRMVLVKGKYDPVEIVLDDLGFTYSEVNGVDVWTGWQFLLDANALSAFDTIYLACGVYPEASFPNNATELATIGANLRAFVEAGGHLYTSDWAYVFAEAAAPELFDFHGADDLDPMAVFAGDSGTVDLTVTDPTLAAHLGASTVPVTFPYPSWAVLDAVDPTARIDLRGSVPLLGGGQQDGAILAVLVPLGSGTILFTSLHQEGSGPPSPLIRWLVTSF